MRKYTHRIVFEVPDDVEGDTLIEDFIREIGAADGIMLESETRYKTTNDIRMIKSSELTEELELLFKTCDLQTLQSKDIGVVEISNGDSPSTIYVINYQE